jgi:protoheme ferro-lyase
MSNNVDLQDNMGFPTFVTDYPGTLEEIPSEGTICVGYGLEQFQRMSCLNNSPKWTNRLASRSTHWAGAKAK